VRDDPEVLTQFIHRCRAREVTATELLHCLRRVDQLRQSKSGEDRKIDDRVLFGVLLVLGEYRPEDLPITEREALISQLGDWYARDPNSGIHGATGWLLRHWGFPEQARKVDQTPVEYALDREWFTLEVKPKSGDDAASSVENQTPEPSFYLTFVVFEPNAYLIGSPSNEPVREFDETLHKVCVTRPFAILDREILRGELQAFGLSNPAADERTGITPDHPAGGPNWYDAVRFCRWLGKQSGLTEDEQPYPDPNTLDPEKYPMDPQPHAQGAPRDWPVRLDRSGFRLPTEAEWEIACRGGMRTPYGFGGDVTLLHHYGWFRDNSEEKGHLSRSLRPSFRGLFDMHGNVWEWCHDWFGDRYPNNQIKDPIGTSQRSARVERGGSWFIGARYCRSADRDGDMPSDRTKSVGFRVALIPSGQARR
jgi:hypothetical protein